MNSPSLFSASRVCSNRAFPPDVCTPWQTRAAPHWFALCPWEEFVDELPRLRRLESAALPEMQKALCTCLFLRHTIANHFRNLPLLLIPSWTTRFAVVWHTSASLMSEILPHLPNNIKVEAISQICNAVLRMFFITFSVGVSAPEWGPRISFVIKVVNR